MGKQESLAEIIPGKIMHNCSLITNGQKLAYLDGLIGRHQLSTLLGINTRIIGSWITQGTILEEPNLSTKIDLILSTIVNPRTNSSTEFTFVDLFAGIGGIRLGFESIGGKCVGTCEWDHFSQQTYRNNFRDRHPILGDITRIDADLIPDHDVLLAGFPCQPFSIAGVSKKNSLGMSHGFECSSQGTLFFDIERILASKRPKAFLLENVKNLTTHDRGNTFKVIMHTLEKKLGYKVFYRVIDANGFVPQHRQRIFLVGFRHDVDFDWNDFIQPRKGEVTMHNILHPEDGSETAEAPYTYGEQARVSNQYIITTKLWAYLKAYKKKHRQAGNGFGYSVVSGEDTCRTLSARYHKDGSEILISRGGNRNPRRLTPRECARLMGYPDSFQIPVSNTQAYRQFGNSVVVPVIEEIARTMKPHIMSLMEESPRKNLHE